MELSRVTFKINSELRSEFVRLTDAMNVSRDALLRETLDDELDYLADHQPNNLHGLGDLRKVWLQRCNQRFSVSLRVQTAQRLSKICTEKAIPRDLFVNEYIRYLVRGAENGSCVSPLNKAMELLTDPRFEYASYEGDHPYDNLFPSAAPRPEGLSSRKAMSSMRWIDWIYLAFENLGGTATLNDLYDEIRYIRPDPLTREWKATVRNIIESHSSDSDNYSTNRLDLFKAVDGIGNGRWKIRAGRTM